MTIVTQFCTTAPNICGSSIWKLLSPCIEFWGDDFSKKFAPLCYVVYKSFVKVRMGVGYSANSYWQSRTSICNNVIWCKCEDMLHFHHAYTPNQVCTSQRLDNCFKTNSKHKPMCDDQSDLWILTTNLCHHQQWKRFNLHVRCKFKVF